MLKLADLPDIVAFCDPAAGKTGETLKRRSARQAIVVAGEDVLGRIFVLHAWAARVPTDAFMDKIVQVFDDFLPRLYGMEANGMQEIFGDAVDRFARDRGKRIPFIPVHQPTNVKKEWRIQQVIQPKLNQGRLFVLPTQVELRAELESFPHYPTMDIVDALASAITLLPERKAISAADEEIQALAAYLRESGAPPEQIRARVDELRREAGMAPASRAERPLPSGHHV